MTDAAALEVIHQAGAWFVLTRQKKPYKHYGWKHRHPSLDEAIAHREHVGELGLIPSSIGSTALDVDLGDWRNCPTPVVSYATPSGGRHLLYLDHEPRGNSKWEAYGCKGDVRSGSGYVNLWGDAPGRLADAITSDGAFQLGFDLPELPWDAVRPTPKEVVDRRRRSSVEVVDAAPRPPAVRPVAASLDLETVPRGARNTSLFDCVRIAAYGRSRADLDLDQWLALVEADALDLNQRFALPLPRDEVREVANSCATWIWSAMPRSYSDDVEAQRRRGLRSGEVRRGRNAARDAAILDALDGGRTQADVGQSFGLAQSTVGRIMSRGDYA